MANHDKSKPTDKNDASPPAQQPAASSLPSDTFVHADPKPAAECKLPDASPEIIAAVDILLKYLMQGKTHWKADVPEPGDRWQPMYEHVLSGTRTDPALDKARETARSALVRIYPGPTQKERIAVIRVSGTTYLRAEVLPWTIGK
jgi:hypothetical protein